MRTFALLVASLSAVTLTGISSAQTVVSTAQQETYVCPKCGKIHVRQAAQQVAASNAITYSTPAGSPVTQVNHQVASSIQPTRAPIASTSRLRAVSGVSNVLAALNAQRARQRIGSLLYDPQLQVVAQRRAQQMAASGLKNHPPGSFAPGRYEGVGWSSSYSPQGVSACFTSDTRMRYAGAAMATGRDGVYFAVVYR